MSDIIFLVYILSLISGSATLGIGISIYLKYRRPVIRWFLWFLFSLFLILLSFIFSHYNVNARTVWIDYSLLADISGKTGSVCFIAAAPFFFCSLLGFRAGKRWKILNGILLLVLIVLYIHDLFLGHLSFLPPVFSILFLAVTVFGLVITMVNFKRIAGKSLRRALLVFFLISLFFMPLILLDMNLHRISPGHWIQQFNNITQPMYFLVVNICCIYFVLKYLSQPSLRKEGSFTGYFLDKYNITEREQEIIEKLLSGLSSKEIAEKVFISPKTVDNHIYNIFRKLGINNRLQLVQMINSNSE